MDSCSGRSLINTIDRVGVAWVRGVASWEELSNNKNGVS